MRRCAKLRCPARPEATIELRYDAREVIVHDLAEEHDPSRFELCAEHVGRMTPPLGWTVREARTFSAVH